MGKATTTIRGLIFDFGGVISDMRWDVARELEREHDLERGTLAKTLYTTPEWREVEVGKGDVEVWKAAAHRALEKVAGRSMPPLHDRWRAAVRPIDANIALIRALRPPYRIAILSNADLTLEDRIRDTYGITHLFDTIVSSAVVGMAKPDHAIYKLAAKRIELPPDECLFIDDAERNIDAAREVGMQAVHFRIHQGDDLGAQLAEHGIRPAKR